MRERLGQITERQIKKRVASCLSNRRMKRSSTAALRREQQKNRLLKRQIEQLKRLQQQQARVQQKINQHQQSIKYTNNVSRADELMLLRLVQRNALIEGIVRIVVTNVVEGGVSIHVQLANHRILHPDTYREGASLPTRWIPLLSRMVADVLTLGYTVVLVDPGARFPEDRVYAPAPDTIQVRWTTVNRRPVYAAFDVSAGGGRAGYWNDRRAATSGGDGGDDDEPIPNSYVLVMYHPSRYKECTSPVARSLPLVIQLEALIANYIRGDTARTRQPLIIESAVRESTKPGVEVPYVLADLSPTGHITHRLQEVGATSKAPSADIDARTGRRRQRRKASALSSTGQPIEFLDPGETVARSTAVPVIDGRDTTVMIQELIAMIGRTMGVSADYLRGGETGGTKLVAGVEASRKQLAVMVNSLQGPIARFLEHVFARADEEILREMFAGGTLTEDTTGRRRQSPPPSDIVQDRFRATDFDEDVAGSYIPQDGDPVGLDDADLQDGGDSDGEENEESYQGLGGEDRVVVQFNNTPYLDYENARLLYQDRIITSEALRHMAARMFRIPESFLTPPDVEIGPFQVLVQPTLHASTAETARDTSENTRKTKASGDAGPPAKRPKVQPQASRRAKLGPPPTSTA